MYVTIDRGTGVAALADPENLQQFHVAISGGGAAEAAAVLGADGTLADDREHVWISVAAVRRWASGRVGPEWEAGFEKMLDYADSKGWLDDDRTRIRAHIEAEGS